MMVYASSTPPVRRKAHPKALLEYVGGCDLEHAEEGDVTEEQENEYFNQRWTKTSMLPKRNHKLTNATVKVIEQR